MKLINNAPRRPKPNECPDSYEKLVPVECLSWDAEANVRKETPSPQLIEDIKNEGFKIALTTRESPDNSDEYLVTDGWQRTQTAKRVGFSHVPVCIYDSLEEATRIAESYSRGKEWGTVSDLNQDYIRIQKVYMEEQGLSEKEAIEKRVKKSPFSENTVRKNYRIAQLPETIKQLMREPENRTEHFKNDWKVEGCLGNCNKTLNKQNAHYIAKKYLNGIVSETDALYFAMQTTKDPDMDVLEQALDNYTSGMDSKEAFVKAKDQIASQKNASQFNVGIINIPEDDKRILSRYITHNHGQSIRSYFNKLVQQEKDDLLNNINKQKYQGKDWALESMKEDMN